MTEGRKSWAMMTGCSSSSDRLSGEDEVARFWSSRGLASTGSAVVGGVVGGEEESVLSGTATSSADVAVLSLLGSAPTAPVAVLAEETTEVVCVSGAVAEVESCFCSESSVDVSAAMLLSAPFVTGMADSGGEGDRQHGGQGADCEQQMRRREERAGGGRTTATEGAAVCG
jgi:hypothetical protein